MKRLPDCYERLAAYIQSVQDKPFAWGTHDCAHFARGAVHAMTGLVPDAPVFGAYSSAAAASRLLKGTSMSEQVSALLGEPMNPLFASRGDVVLYVHEQYGDALGICAGATFCAPGDERLEHRPMFEAVRAWAVR